MANVITLTLNACIDKSVVVDKLVPDKKLYCTEPKLEPGGGGINVARGIRRLGGDVDALYFAGGHHGEVLNRLLGEEKIHAIPVRSDHPTRENWMVFESSTGRQYRLVTPGAAISAEDSRNFLKQVNASTGVSIIVLSGSVPEGTPADFVEELVQTAKHRKVKLVVDTKGESLLAALRSGVFLIKPNQNELAYLTKALGLPGGSVQESLREIIAKDYCEVAVVSLGEAGAMFATRDQFMQISAPPVRKQSTVGAGDSMVAGIVYMLGLNKSIEEAVRFGIACGTAATMNQGTELFHPEDAQLLYVSMQELLAQAAK